MKNTDIELLAEAYLAITKKTKQLPNENELPSTEPNETVSTGPVDEPAPGVEMEMETGDGEINSADYDTTGVPVNMEQSNEYEDPRLSTEDESEEDNMAVSNLASIKDSIMKIASSCANGYHLEPWQQQKLAIAMDNLAEVARRLT